MVVAFRHRVAKAHDSLFGITRSTFLARLVFVIDPDQMPKLVGGGVIFHAAFLARRRQIETIEMATP